MRFNWQNPEWPNFKYDLSNIQELLYHYAIAASSLAGGLNQLSDEMQIDTLIDLMVSEALKTSEIEGEKFNDEDVRSSIRKELGIFTSNDVIKDPKAMGIAKLMISVRKTFEIPLSKTQLFEWHDMVMSDPHMRDRLEIAKWRTSVEPMQIVSGPFGHEKIHFEAPPSNRVDQEMTQFLEWFNQTTPLKDTLKIPGPVRAAIAHLYFESIHPFADGNGRIGRAIAEKALSQDLAQPILLSLSTTIQKNRKEYYAELSRASHYNLNITPWITYFVKTVYQAQLDSKKQILFTLQKAKFWNQHQGQFNPRQEKVLQRMFKAGVEGFKGGISAQKYMTIAACSKATATRDLTNLLAKGCLSQLSGSGRSTRYAIALPHIGIKENSRLE